MNPCLCGHWHAASCPHCGCSYYEPDDGQDGESKLVGPRFDSDPYRGQYGTTRRFQA